jgi:dTDP-4-dehydrorhamnose reductase
MKQRILVIGAGGFLGGRVAHSGDCRFEMIPVGRAELDITNSQSVESSMAFAGPDIVVLTAALADIDRCEKDPDLARAVNVGGVKNVAEACARRGVRMLFTSSGAVFDGEAEHYAESDTPNPISVYGKTKAEAEQVVRDMMPRAVIVRFSMGLGYSLSGGTNALLDKLQAAFREGKRIFAPASEYRNAIDADTLTRWMLDLCAAPEARGTFHLGSADALSRYEIVGRLAEAMGYSKELVTAQDAAPERAPRGRRQHLVPGRIREFSSVPVPSCIEVTERCVHVTA